MKGAAVMKDEEENSERKTGAWGGGERIGWRQRGAGERRFLNVSHY